MRIHQDATLTADPVQLMDATTKRYVDNLTSGAAAPVFITDITATGSGAVGNKTYVSGTIPANKVILSGDANTKNVTVKFLAEGPGTFYSPVISVTCDDPNVTFLPATGIATLTEDTYDKRLFAGSIQLLNVTKQTVVTVASSSGAVAQATIKIAAAGPAIISLSMGPNPGTQTELKAGDVISVTGVVQNSAVSVVAIAGGVLSSQQTLTIGNPDSAGVGFKTISGNVTIGTGSGTNLQLSAKATDSTPTTGSTFTTSTGKDLDQTYPVIGAFTVTYPSNQTALKDGESASVNALVSVATGTFSTVYSDDTSELYITNPSTYEETKTVTRIGGNYNVTTNNFKITATKIENGAHTSASTNVRIVNVAPTGSISIVGNPSRLQSSNVGNAYTVNLTLDQDVGAHIPTLELTSGRWVDNFSGGPISFSRILSITDADIKGDQMFTTFSVTGRSGLVGSMITSGANYIIGGFLKRTLTYSAFSQIADIGTNVVDTSKLLVSYRGSSNLTFQPSTSYAVQGFTITDSSGSYLPTGSYLYLTDSVFAGSNTSGTLQVDIQENA